MELKALSAKLKGWAGNKIPYDRSHASRIGTAC
jgi:hypothetical protein